MDKFDDLGKTEEAAQVNDSEVSPREKRDEGLSGEHKATKASAKTPVVSEMDRSSFKESDEVESSVTDDELPFVNTEPPDSVNSTPASVEPDNVLVVHSESEAKVEPNAKIEEVNASNCQNNLRFNYDENNTTTLNTPADKKEDYVNEVGLSDNDGHSDVSNTSLSSVSFKSEKEYLNRLNYLLREARFFLMKSNNDENIKLSKSKNVWSTPPCNEFKINQALKDAKNVVLIFSVKESGTFSGFARLISESCRDGETVNWTLPPGLRQRDLGGVFPVDWISKNDLSFLKTQHLFNPWNDCRPVKIGRDGQEIEPRVGLALCRLFPMDSSTDWNGVLKRSKEAAENVSLVKVTSRLGSSGSSSKDKSFRERRDTRGRFPNVYSNSRSSTMGGSHEFYKRGYGYRGNDMNVNHRYTRKRPYNDTYSKGRSSSHNQGYPDYMTRDYHRRPPPAPPSPYPPPAPFDNLPPLPRYYDVPPLPDCYTSSTSSVRERSAYPYEKSRTCLMPRYNRYDRDGDRDRDRERKTDGKYWR